MKSISGQTLNRLTRVKVWWFRRFGCKVYACNEQSRWGGYTVQMTNQGFEIPMKLFAKKGRICTHIEIVGRLGVTLRYSVT